MVIYVGDKNARDEERARRARASVAFVARGPNLTGARSSGEKAMGLRGAQPGLAPLILATPRVSTGAISPAAAARQVALAQREGGEQPEGAPASETGKATARGALGVASTMLAFAMNPMMTVATLMAKIGYSVATTGKAPDKAPIAGPMAVYETIEKIADKMGGDKAPGPGPESIGPPANEQAGVFTYDEQGNFLSYTNARPDPVDVAPAPGVDTTTSTPTTPDTTFDSDPAKGYGGGFDTGTGGTGDTGSEGSSGSAAP